MRLIPNILLNQTSSAENRIFDLLEATSFGQDWTAFHSVNCSEHAYKHWCEIDFLIVGPKGLFVLEVKGGRVSYTNGLWRFKDRFDRENTKTEGPFVQARTAMYALRELLTKRYKLSSVLRESTVVGFGVIFPDQPWDVDSPEMPRAIVATPRACADPEAFTRYLRQLFQYWSNKHSTTADLTSDELKTLRHHIRPDVDVYPPFSSRLGTALKQIQHLTDEQYERLEAIEQNDRVIISGGAGTGKTYLLVQCARRASAQHMSVLVITESPILAAQLRLLISDRDITVKAIDQLEGRSETYDVAFVDEGQDLMTMATLDRISLLVKGGLEHGTWRWFMDENNQAHVGTKFDPDAYEYLSHNLPTGKPTRLPLLRNVRNTREIISSVTAWTGAEVGKAEWTGHGGPPEIVVCDDLPAMIGRIASTIDGLTSRDIALDQIGIICSSTLDTSILEQLPGHIRNALIPIDPSTVRAQLMGRLTWGSAAQFKGLERPIMLLVGFCGSDAIENQRTEFYVASTRANYSLFVFCDRKFATVLRARGPSRH